MNGSGWIIDAWNSEATITLWLKTDRKENIFLRDTFHPSVYARCHNQEGKTLLWKLARSGIISLPAATEKLELWTGQRLPVYSLLVLNQSLFRKVLSNADRWKSALEFFNTDILPVHGWFIKQDLYPLARVTFASDGDNLTEIKRTSDKSEIFSDYPKMPSLLITCPNGRLISPGPDNPLTVHFSENEQIEITSRPDRMISQLNEILAEEDPDIVFTSEGDDFIMPFLFGTAEKNRIKLLLDRDPVHSVRSTGIKQRSFFSYGRVVYKTTPFPLFGRLHIDRGQSFFYSETDLEGIFEMSRFSRLTIQKLGRSSPGSAMSAMEDEQAMKMNTLIPRIKGKSSAIKPLRELLRTDQGGMSFRPPVGIFTNVAELDFRSLYPNLMYSRNISGETVNCNCCRNSGGIIVPETPYHTCTRRRGIVPETIKQLLDRRDLLKGILQAGGLTGDEKTLLDLKSSAIKWCLVTSFGYTGYKNAKYGRREAHEAITAWGRFAIQTAKECAEKRGYVLLHSLTDSMWLQGEIDDRSLQELTKEVFQLTGVMLFHEMSYSWIVYAGSRMNPGHAVATRYYGRGTNGKMKVRGTALRKKDTPLLVKNFQQELVDAISHYTSPAEVRINLETLDKLRRHYLDLVQNSTPEPALLTVRKSLGHSSDEYKQNNATSVVLQILKETGINYVAGQSVKYIVRNREAKDPLQRYIPLHLFSGDFDRKFYSGLIEEAWLEITEFFLPEEITLFSKKAPSAARPDYSRRQYS